jgi:hypothetical protein
VFLRLSPKNDFIVIVVRQCKVSKGKQQFLTTKVNLKLCISLASRHHQYRLVLHEDGCGFDLFFPRVPALDPSGVADMVKEDYVLQGEDKTSLEDMNNLYNSLFTNIRSAGDLIVKKKSYRFENEVEMSPAFFNKDETSRELKLQISKTKQLVTTIKGRKQYQWVFFANWFLSVVDDTVPLAEAEEDEDINPLIALMTNSTLKDDDESMGGAAGD